MVQVVNQLQDEFVGNRFGLLVKQFRFHRFRGSLPAVSQQNRKR